MKVETKETVVSNAAFEQAVLAKLDSISEEMIDGIKSIVAIDSVQDTPQEHMPYGKGVATCLQQTLALAKALGFEVENVDNQAGIAKYGEGDAYVGIFGHLDVVPVGDGWNHPPFEPYEDENGRIFARGILDNKGPILANLYALYAIKECSIALAKPVWIVFGTNEESGFHDMDYYLQKKDAPIMGWTPDCKYPVVYAERGRSIYTVRASQANQKEFHAFVNEYLLESSPKAERLKLNIQDPEFGEMVMRGIKLLDKEDGYAVQFTFSYPASITNEEIQKRIEAVLHDKLTLTCTLNWNPVHFAKDSFLCQTLQDTYESITGMDGTPVTTTGGTYAKIVPNIVPFGPSFPGQKGIGHNPNEWMDRSDLLTNAKIYALSILRVAGIKEG